MRPSWLSSRPAAAIEVVSVPKNRFYSANVARERQIFLAETASPPGRLRSTIIEAERPMMDVRPAKEIPSEPAPQLPEPPDSQDCTDLTAVAIATRPCLAIRGWARCTAGSHP